MRQVATCLVGQNRSVDVEDNIACTGQRKDNISCTSLRENNITCNGLHKDNISCAAMALSQSSGIQKLKLQKLRVDQFVWLVLFHFKNYFVRSRIYIYFGILL